ncbi:Gfo/Idh/MocA family protein [Pedobacter helvus]|uniref:Gfo/Idh/MocA family protein n=1 Tax=Pedobacter helvus TaxID=2563444 RepID=A0ABW9JJ56_9SPHI|nr:Gfo/Idh/MocA family oxidoreductase [Pedobacter ureilyticus]
MKIKRRDFIQTITLAGAAMALPRLSFAHLSVKKRIGIIGLDTSHSLAFTQLLNAQNQDPQLDGYQVVAAYPYGSKDLALSKERIPKQMVEIQQFGVKIVDSIAELLAEVDVVLLETNDGRLHLTQALEVIKAGKPLFIDKPLAASLKDAKAIFDAAKAYNVPVFSASSLRFMDNVVAIRSGKHGQVLGADTFSPATIEPTHPDLFWYGIHGVETLFAVMGPDCVSVTRFYTEETDVVVGKWKDGRVGTFRGTRTGKADFGGTCFTGNGTFQLGPYLGYKPLLVEIIKFFNTKIAPVSASETLAILAFMEAADESKRRGGKTIKLKPIY